MTSVDETLMDWLRDAHAAEQQAETMLKGMTSRLEHYPDLRARIEQHIGETQNQADRIRGCIEKRGGSTSTVKDAGGKLLAMGQALSGLFVSDEVMKGAIAGYAFENMEIASYEILIAAAEEAGDHDTKQVCEEILEEERAMADWLEDHLPDLTSQYLLREQSPEVAAKR
ncbi:ferritin-like domain-containing protein [Microbaculum marinum]|uniref:Ferritin-like domain-containing protein n=1 Tax=Microbaculum marinum TaxID=1764581 RepID=A0AAW9RCW4_9HYPH